MRVICMLLLFQQALSYAITQLPSKTQGQVATITGITQAIVTNSEVLPATTALVDEQQVPFSALVTIAPQSANPLARRQRCFDDRGFSVDCATWTGYYYTWGPPGNPYLGGPGEGGDNSGGGATVVVVASNSAAFEVVNLPALLGMICLGLALFL